MANPRKDEPPALLPPLPAWRLELRERVEAYRASHPPPRRGGTAGAGAPPAPADVPEEKAAPGVGVEDTRVLPFRHQPSLVVMSASGSAEPIADPFPLVAPGPEHKPEASAQEQLDPAPEPSWGNDTQPNYLQLPLPMGTAAAAGAGKPPAGIAPPAVRFRAGLTDAAVVIAAAVLFALAGWASQSFPAFSTSGMHPLLPALIAVPAGLAALYLLLCAYAGGTTIGMRRHGLKVRAWDGPLTAAARRRRGWASVVSLAALGMGFVWMVCDRQHLSWHDAISRTCVVLADGREECS